MSKQPEKKGKSGRNRQQEQTPEKESACIVQPCFVLNSAFATLAVHDSTGNFLGLLNSKPHQAYQKPAVAFCKTTPALHPLLVGLKTAQSFLFLQVQQLSANLPDEYYSLSVEYECNMEFPDAQDPEAFRNWFAAHPNRPLLVSGIRIADSHYKASLLNLDLTLAPTYEHDFSKNFSPRFFEPLQIAILAYNDMVTLLLEHGLLVCSVFFLNEHATKFLLSEKMKQFTVVI